jgi:hypothetical protein
MKNFHNYFEAVKIKVQQRQKSSYSTNLLHSGKLRYDLVTVTLIDEKALSLC